MNDHLKTHTKNSAIAAAGTVPQSVQLDPAQVKNTAGGFTFKVGPIEKLNRFLFLGTQGGTYYISEKDLTKQNVDAIVAAIKSDGGMAVAERVLEVSTEGLALRQNPTLFVWALLTKYGDEATRRFVHDNTVKVVRTGTMLFQLTDYLKHIHGSWSMGRKRALAAFYESRTPQNLAYQVSKYRQRNGWSHLDLIRIAHPKGADEGQAAVYEYLQGNLDGAQLEEAIGPNALSGSDRAFKAQGHPEDVAALVRQYGLSWEMISTQDLNTAAVWDELVQNSGYQALLRNLNRLTKAGWLEPNGENRKWLLSRLTNEDFIAKSMVHPFNIYMAARTYGSGGSQMGYYSVRTAKAGGNTWTPISGVTDALDDAFTMAFKNVEPSGLRHLVALDVSGSMGQYVLPGITAAEASAALSLILLRTEPDTQVMGFSTKFIPLNVTPKMTISQVHRAISGLPFGGTDCAVAFNWAKDKGYKFDAFVTITDNETWAGRNHPHVALKEYRKASGIPARSLVVGMAANDFTIADPNDAGMLDYAGLSSDLPVIARNFFTGKF